MKVMRDLNNLKNHSSITKSSRDIMRLKDKLLPPPPSSLLFFFNIKDFENNPMHDKFLLVSASSKHLDDSVSLFSKLNMRKQHSDFKQ